MTKEQKFYQVLQDVFINGEQLKRTFRVFSVKKWNSIKFFLAN